MKILIAVGSSGRSDEVLYTGVKFARMIDSPVTVLNVIKDPGKRVEAQAVVGQSVALAQNVDTGVDTIESKIRLGHPAEEIVNEANERNYRLIVVGTWPNQNLWHRLLAPTTERVVMQAACPVLVVKGKLAPLRHILLCVSGADTHSKAAHFLSDIVNRMTGDLKITVLHVMSQINAGPGGQESWQLRASAQRLIEAATPEGQWLLKESDILRRTRAHIEPKVRHGLVVDEVLMETLEGKCELLVIGAPRQAGWQRFLLDDLSHQIIVRADRPILVV